MITHNYFKALPAVAENKENMLNPEKVKLGKILYYDTRKQGARNSPTVFNAALHNMQFWDGREKDVEEQSGMPILNSVEMAIPNKEFLIKRLETIPLYQNMFKVIFPGEAKTITYEN